MNHHFSDLIKDSCAPPGIQTTERHSLIQTTERHSLIQTTERHSLIQTTERHSLIHNDFKELFNLGISRLQFVQTIF